MKKCLNNRKVVISIIFLLFLTCFVPITLPKIENHKIIQSLKTDNGHILYTPMQSKITYLINKNGDVKHTWQSEYTPGESVYMLSDYSIFYTIKLTLAYGGAGGGVQKISWDGNLLWDFRYYDDQKLSHHDIQPLPNGNVLLIAWEFKTREEAIIAGRNPNELVGDTLMPEHIIEVKPTGPTTGDIVWEWHVWDHLIQDYDLTKDNYGIVADHPELIDINYCERKAADWLHCNSIDYNEEFDQILISIRNFNEIWVIDHSTTTEEAAGHTGGDSGKGGDLLYRWGNPQAYRAGNANDRKFFGQHDASWIDEGYPEEGNILVFNNGIARYSSVDEIVPPVDDNGNYFLVPGNPYGPEEQIWIYTAENPPDWQAALYSGAIRIYNGNTLICDGPAGWFFEVTPEKDIVWEFVNPYPNIFQNNVYKIQYFPPNSIPPYANFIFSPTNPIKNEIIYFNDKSIDNEQIISWNWDFGDGHISTDQNTTHQYSEIGTFFVTLKVTDNNGLTDTITKNITILNDLPPVINNLKAIPPIQIPGGNVNISAKVTDDSGLADVCIIIQYPDSHSENNSIIENKNNSIYYYENKFDMTGQHNYSIWSVDKNGNQAVSTISQFVITNEYTCYAYVPHKCYKFQEIQFNGYVVKGQPPYTWLWVFGDGETSNNQNPVHKYNKIGNYTIILTVTDTENKIVNNTTWVLIQDCQPPLTPDINGPRTGKLNINYDYHFSLTENQDINNFYIYIDWDDETNTGWLGPYLSDDILTINHSWSKTGSYTIKAKTKNLCEEISTWSSLEITIPKNKIDIKFIFQEFLKNYLNFFSINRMFFKLKMLTYYYLFL